MSTVKETYLGDGLYASDDGFQIALRAPREVGDHFVYMEPEVISAFIRFLETSRGLKIDVQKAQKPVGYMGDVNGPGCDPDVQ